MKRFVTLPVLIFITTLGALVFVPRPPRAVGYAKPEVVSRSWHLDFTHGTPTPIAYQDVQGRTHWFYYMPYKVVNNTNKDILFVPEFTIYTTGGDIIEANEDIPPGLFAAIKKQLGNPLLKSPVAVGGKLLQGRDYAKQSVAIWPIPPENSNGFSVFVNGISGETKTIQDPATGKKVTLRRTDMIRYRTPGQYPTPENQPVNKVGQRAVMR